MNINEIAVSLTQWLSLDGNQCMRDAPRTQARTLKTARTGRDTVREKEPHKELQVQVSQKVRLVTNPSRLKER